MKTVKQAIEDVADKRHARLERIIGDEEACRRVVAYLNDIKQTWKEHKDILTFVDGLIAGYSAKL